MSKKLVELSENLLDASVKKSDALSKEKYDIESLENSKLTLGFLRATLNAHRIAQRYFQMGNVQEKIEQLKGIIKKKNL